MRKLAWFIIFLAILTPSLVAAGLAYPPFGDALHYAFIDFLGVGTANLLTGAATGFLLWGSANGLQAATVFLSICIFGWITGILFKRFAWDRRPGVMKTAEQKIYQHAPIASLPQTMPEQVTQVAPAPKPAETKKPEEVVAE